MFAPARYNFRCNFSMSIVNLMKGENFSISNEPLDIVYVEFWQQILQLNWQHDYEMNHNVS